MAINDNNSSGLNTHLYNEFVAAAQYAAYENSISRSVMDARTLAAGTGKIVRVPVWDSMTAEVITNEAAATPRGTETSSVDVTIAEIVAAHRVNDMLRDTAFENVIAQLASQSGMSVAEGMDTQAFAKFDSVTAGVGTSGAALTVEDLFEAAKELRANKYRGALAAVLSPRQIFDLQKELGTTGGANLTASGLGDQVLRSGVIGNLAGITLYSSSLLPDDGTDVTGCVFGREAFVQVMRGGISVEQDRQGLARATDIIVTANAGANLVRDEFAVKVVSAL